MSEAEAILNRLIGLHPKAIDLDLGRLVRLLDRLGDPHLAVPPGIHVAGTNGKGSTSAFLRAIAEAAGLAVHVYSSPHLVHFRERIRLAGQLVSDEALLAALRQCEAVNAGEPITFFEITTAAAFLLFSQRPADLVILEVGLGGRLDATNVISNPLVNVITSISRDHEAYLGDDIAGIAREKAGILKRDRPAVFAPQDGDISAILEQEARRVGAGPLAIGGQDWMAYEEHGRLVYQGTEGLKDLPLPRLMGRHQLTNAGAAIAALDLSGFEISDEAIARGMQNVQWPGRLQQLTEGTLVKSLPGNAELWLDGGHNPAAGVVLSSALADLEERAPKPLYMIVGMLKTKDAKGYLSAFRGLARDILTVPVTTSEAGMDPMELASLAQDAGIPASAAPSLREALHRLSLLDNGDAPRILISGSLYLVGEALALNGTPPQ